MTQAVTAVDSGQLIVSAADVQKLEYKLVGVWLATCLARVLFDFTSAKMFVKLEL